MKNVTISMDDDVLSWVRVEAAKRGESVSRYFATLALERKQQGPHVSQRESLERFLSYPRRDLTRADGTLPSREEIYDDALLHRFEHPDLSSGPAKPGED
ncbi:hypothetical protein JOD31_002399 [Methylopila capsulata]|uniref:CopG family transcriptional regulator n=1 Tax=Methylopila capsulata TaxID=61654 RepID=A0A9W6IUD2_9HYPH|nr:hypothetical protein [Methylopila capsulata]MBM7852157.1 hypothetical protein [Methylopila capsulata]GLK56363.1 hypothetical protein GCM10008170_23820 [Methylopila capsulata]